MLIKLSDVHFSYKSKSSEVRALSGISMNIQEGQFVSIIGSNGSGKSTFAKILNGLMIPESGTVQISEKVGMVFQNPDTQIVGETVEEDIAFGPENLGLTSEEIRKRVNDAIRATGIESIRKSRTAMLSGGQKQVVAIAGVLALRTKCIVLDEATSMLDPEERQIVQNEIHLLNKEYGIAIIQITNNMEECVDSDYMYVFDKGKICIQGTPNEVFRNKNVLRDIGLGLPAILEFEEKIGISGILCKDELVNEIARRIKCSEM